MAQKNVRSKFAYALSDMASNLSWGTVGSYLMVYYTDVAKISAVAIGTMFLITRIWDAINDPIMGIIIDKTHSRWGKCRPYFLWMALPLAIIMVLTYMVPEIGDTGKLIYAYITFTLLGMIYTAINIPVTAILPRLTSDLQERTVYGSFRGLGALMGALLVGALTLPLVGFLGGGNPAKGYRLTMVVYAVLALVLFITVFFNIKEIAVKEEEKKTSFGDGFKAAKGNLPWLITLIIGTLLQMTMGMKGAGMVYYFTYTLHRPELIPLMSIAIFCMVIPMFFLPFITKRIGKRNTVIAGNILSLIGFGLVWMSGNNIPLLFAGNIIGYMGIGMNMVFVLISDTVDYGEWKNGVRSEGFLSAAASFGQKLGVGLGGAIGAWIIGLGGYVAGAENQTASALMGIKFNYVFAPIISCVITIILMLFYQLDKVAPQMMEDLKNRRAAKS